jgi:hypothetical protein
MARGSPGAHLSSIGGRGGVGVASGDGRRQSSDGTAVVARMSVQCGDELSHGWPWEIEWGLGKGLESLVGHERKRRRELTGSANGGRWRTAVLSSAHEGKAGRDFIGRATLRGSFARASWPTGATTWAQRRLMTCSGVPASGGSRCAHGHVGCGRVAPA